MADRTAKIHRKTKETDVSVELNLDGAGKYEIDTGIGFLDHMLSHLSKHGKIDLVVKAKGDLNVDAHHTVEDIAICLHVAATTARLATGLGGLTPGRAGFAPAGRNTKFHGGIASSNSLRPTGPGRTDVPIRPSSWTVL